MRSAEYIIRVGLISHGCDVETAMECVKALEKLKGRKVMSTLLKEKPIRMISGKGENAVTQYHCGKIRDAKEKGVPVWVARRSKKTGKIEEVPTRAIVLYHDLCGQFGDSHSNAGEGKYIDNAAFSKNRSQVRGAQYVNPYLPGEEARCYFSIVETFMANIIKKFGIKFIGNLCADVAYTEAWNHHLIWRGRRNSEACLAYSDWFTADQIWKAVLKLTPELLSTLKKSKSGVKDADYKTPKEKFITDLEVMRRATCVVDVATGVRSITGGATPCALPLEQAGFSIDKRYLSYGEVNKDGDEFVQHYYRLVIGRREPHNLGKIAWSYEGTNSSVAYLSKKAQKAVKKRIA